MAWKKGQSGNPAGRRLSPATKARQEAAQKVLAAGTTPLEILIEAMRVAYEQGGAMAAAAYAKEAAPYVHPKLSAIEAKIDQRICDVSSEPLSPDDWNKQYGAAN